MKQKEVLILILSAINIAGIDHHGDDYHGEYHARKHHIAVFNGANTNFEYESTDYSPGLAYEYRISELIVCFTVVSLHGF